MVDISFQGATLALSCRGLGKGMASTNLLLDFGDEGAPVEIQQTEVVGTSGNFQGTLITWTRYQPIQMDISLIPGSASDMALRALLYATHIGGMGGLGVIQSEAIIESATLTVPAIYTKASILGASTVTAGSSGTTKYTFGPGRMTVGSMGQSANSEGKMMMRRYHFVFEGAMCPA